MHSTLCRRYNIKMTLIILKIINFDTDNLVTMKNHYMLSHVNKDNDLKTKSSWFLVRPIFPRDKQNE